MTTTVTEEVASHAEFFQALGTGCVTYAVQMQLRNNDNVVTGMGSENVTQVIYACGTRSSKPRRMLVMVHITVLWHEAAILDMLYVKACP